jgi:hypothetical protein
MPGDWIEIQDGMPFQIGGIMEFVHDKDGLVFLERKLVGFGMDRYRYVRIYDHTH